MMNLAELKRLRHDFEARASEYHDLEFRLVYIVRGMGRDPIQHADKHHIINLWQHMGFVNKDSIPTALGNPVFTNYGMADAEITCYGLVSGEQTELFVKMAKRAGSLVGDPLTNKLVVDGLSKALKSESGGKPVLALNANLLAVWLNVVMTVNQKYQPGCLNSQGFEVDLFTASLTALDYTITELETSESKEFVMADSKDSQDKNRANQTINQHFHGSVGNVATGSQNFSQQAAVGPTLTQENLTVDPIALAAELLRLRNALLEEAEPDQISAAAQVRYAEQEAQKNEPDQSKIKGYLEKGGKVLYDMGTKIGTSLIVELIKQSTGIGGPHH